MIILDGLLIGDKTVFQYDGNPAGALRRHAATRIDGCAARLFHYYRLSRGEGPQGVGNHVLALGMDHDCVDEPVLEHSVDIARLHVLLVGEVLQPRIVVCGGHHFDSFDLAEGTNPGRGVGVGDSQESYYERFQRDVSYRFL